MLNEYPLDNIRVALFTHFAAGEIAVQYLGAIGADATMAKSPARYLNRHLDRDACLELLFGGNSFFLRAILSLTVLMILYATMVTHAGFHLGTAAALGVFWTWSALTGPSKGEWPMRSLANSSTTSGRPDETA